MITALVTVVNGRAYEEFAEQLREDAARYFHPTETTEFVILPGRSGWPAATMYRWHALLGALPQTHYVFLIDADMRIAAEIGPEILPGRFGITATMHPGYVHSIRDELPYERRISSACYVPLDSGRNYFCGGFVGGDRLSMRILGTTIAGMIDADQRVDVTPTWHDESALNCALVAEPPALSLSPSYCYPDDDSWYQTIWREKYERKIVALDKTTAVRGAR